MGTVFWLIVGFKSKMSWPLLKQLYGFQVSSRVKDFQDFINIFILHYLNHIIARCRGNLRQHCDQQTFYVSLRTE